MSTIREALRELIDSIDANVGRYAPGWEAANARVDAAFDDARAALATYRHPIEAEQECERLNAENDELRKSLQGMLLTDPHGARAHWPEHIAAHETLKGKP
jgi:hypothetical protein